MKKIQLAIFILVLLISCTENNNYEKQIKKQVEKLHSTNEKKSFLQKIYTDSKGIDLEIENLEKNYIKNKEQVKRLRNKKDSLIIINRLKTKEYLNKHSYPTDSVFSEQEKKAIYYAVFFDYKEKEQLKYLEVFNDLYKSGNIDKHSYLGLLLRIYYLSENSFYKLDKKQTIDQMINELYPEILKLKYKQN